MHAFLSRFATVVRGVLSGFDRLFFRGTLRCLAYPLGLRNYLWANRILFKEFGDHSQEVTARLIAASLRQAEQLGREIRYLNSSQARKEDIAREIAARDRIRSGLICVLRCVDPCMSFAIQANHRTRRLEIKYRQRKCVHLYHYQIHPVFGFMHARIQTWFPFRIYVCINGREWLARQMDQAGLRYQRRDNTFTWLEDIAQAQALLDQQVQTDWPSLLGGLADSLNPAHADIFARFRCRHYWSVTDSEWASDLMFRARADVEAVYPRLVNYAVSTFGAADVMRFLGQAIPASGKVPHRCRHEVVTNVKERVEGLRIKHWLNFNSVKLYDKGSVLRAECTLRQPQNFKVCRPKEGDPEGPQSWRRLRLGIADLQRRSEVSQAVNDRYLDALAAVHIATPLRQLAEPLCQPVLEPARQRRPNTPQPESSTPSQEASPTLPSMPNLADDTPAVSGSPPTPALDPVERRRRVRALNPLAAPDAALLEAVSRHEFMINGLRNRDLRQLLFGPDPSDVAEKRRRSAAVTRQLRLLRAHGLIQKIPKTHRYLVTEHGRQAITALLAARNASAEKLTRCAA